MPESPKLPEEIQPLPTRQPATTASKIDMLVKKVGEIVVAVNGLRAWALAQDAEGTGSEPQPQPEPTPTPTPVPEPPTPNPAPGPTQPTTKPGGEAAVRALLGPLSKSHPLFTPFIKDFTLWWPSQYNDTTKRYNNYYDRVAILYGLGLLLNDAKLISQGHEILLNWRKSYAEKTPGAPYAMPANQAMLLGLECHWHLIGDEDSRKAIGGIYAQAMEAFLGRGELANTKMSYMENRIQAKCLHAALSAYRVGASYKRPDGWLGVDGVGFGVDAWPNVCRRIVDAIIKTQSADGLWRWTQGCDGQLNYMVGMLADVLGEYVLAFPSDKARVVECVRKAYEALWKSEWDEASKSFHYLSVHGPCAATGGGDFTKTNDLNGLFLNGFGWLYQWTGQPTWLSRGDKVLQGLIDADLIQGGKHLDASKQFNQHFAGLRYFGLSNPGA